MGTHAITRSGNTAPAVTVSYQVGVDDRPGATSANAADFPGGVFPSGTVNLPAGGAPQNLTILSNADATVEGDETYKVTLTSTDAGVTFTGGRAVAYGTIANDDSGSGAGTINHGTTSTVPFRLVSSARPLFTQSQARDTGTARTMIFGTGMKDANNGPAVRTTFGGSGNELFYAIGKYVDGVFSSILEGGIEAGDAPASGFLFAWKQDTDGNWGMYRNGVLTNFVSNASFNNNWAGITGDGVRFDVISGPAATNVSSGN